MRYLTAFLAFSICAGAQDGQVTGPKVYVTESNSWESSGSAYGAFSGGARPQTVEVIKTFGQRCPSVTVTIDKGKADYVVLFNRDGGKDYLRRRDKIAIFMKNGDVLYAGSTRSVGSAIHDSCSAIEERGSEVIAATSSDNKLLPTSAEARAQPLPTPKFLHNADILSLRQADFSDKVIIARIHSSLGLYEVGTADLLTLKAAGVSQDIIAAMIAAPDHY